MRIQTTQRLWQTLGSLNGRIVAVILFSLAFLIRVSYMLTFHTYDDLSRTELERTALSFAHTGVYGNPYAIPTGPTAHVSPGYTLILAAIFRVLGDGIPGEIVKQGLAVAVLALSFALLPWAAHNFRIDRRAGILAGLALALAPMRPYAEILGDWETPYTVLALLFVSVATVQIWNGTDFSNRRAAVYGVIWGMSLLFVSALLALCSALLLLLVAFTRQTPVPIRLRFAFVTLCVVAIFLAPWVIRNERALGAPIITRSNFGLELRLSNNDLASPDQRVNYNNGVFAMYHPLLSVPEAEKVRRLGEVAYNKLAMQQAREWIRAHPAAFLGLTLGRVRCFWFYRDPYTVKTIVLGAGVLLGLIGWPVLFLSNQRTAVVLGSVLLIFPLPNYLVHVTLRQELPIHWILVLMAANLVCYVLSLNTMQPNSPSASLRDTPVPC